MKLILFILLILLNLPLMALADIDLPVEHGIITSGVGLRLDPFGSGKMIFHRGIDIAVPVGTPVRATRKGRVIFAGERRGYGNTVIIEHSNGDRTLYGHNALVRVTPGEMVESGFVVALSGNTGRSTGPHVHFEQLLSGRPITEMAENEETTVPEASVPETPVPQLANNDDQRYQLELQMDDSVNSILRQINRSGNEGQGG